MNMYEIRGGYQQTTEALEVFMKRDMREKMVTEIKKAQALELKALDLLKEIVELL